MGEYVMLLYGGRRASMMISYSIRVYAEYEKNSLCLRNLRKYVYSRVAVVGYRDRSI